MKQFIFLIDKWQNSHHFPIHHYRFSMCIYVYISVNILYIYILFVKYYIKIFTNNIYINEVSSSFNTMEKKYFRTTTTTNTKSKKYYNRLSNSFFKMKIIMI